ncbi:uncharacterized protein PV09_07471 [Verruconis gallopava]|uniref:Xylanolytic transcriptional activator regulatory domain-containing protein n=1 Tax=Verruconis gallopava TaxID=253628 RepID=A0A0D2A3F9_9PEZI|nr:uncharacterized protein PV09_07471 [Verruconis gallopava]KIW00945.1 hypothetical protein PV09_07471 [Verruconis gallopava]
MFDLGVEMDSLAIAQGSLLLTYYTPLEDPRAHSYWLSIAIQHSKLVHAHDYRTYAQFPAERTVPLKRLWWCCIVRDRSLSLGLRRPLQISKAAVDPMPPPLSEQDIAAEMSNSRIYSTASKQDLLQTFNKLCMLSIYLTDAIEIMYPTWEACSSTLPSKVSFEQKKQRLLEAESQLDEWYNESRKTELAVSPGDSAAVSLLVLQNLGYMYYYAAKASIHSKVILESILDTRIATNGVTCRLESNIKLEQAVNGMTLILIDLLQAKAINYLPAAAVALASLPLAWHVVGSRLAPKSRDSETLEKGVTAYNKMMRIWQVMYEGTDRVLETITELVQQIELENSILSIHRTPIQLFNSKNREANSWAKILLLQPESYSRVILGLDISLSLGRKICREDLPALLQPLEHKNVTNLMSLSLTAPDLQNYSNSQQEVKHIGAIDSNYSESATCPLEGENIAEKLDDEVESEFRGPWTVNSIEDRQVPRKTEDDIFEKLLQGYAEASPFSPIFT